MSHKAERIHTYRHPARTAPAPLAKDVHRNRTQANEDMDPSNNAKHLLGTLRRKSGCNEVVHPERVNVPQIGRRKRFRRFVPVTVSEVAVDSDSHEPNAEVLQTEEEDGRYPRILDFY